MGCLLEQIFRRLGVIGLCGEVPKLLPPDPTASIRKRYIRLARQHTKAAFEMQTATMVEANRSSSSNHNNNSTATFFTPRRSECVGGGFYYMQDGYDFFQFDCVEASSRDAAEENAAFCPPSSIRINLVSKDSSLWHVDVALAEGEPEVLEGQRFKEGLSVTTDQPSLEYSMPECGAVDQSYGVVDASFEIHNLEWTVRDGACQVDLLELDFVYQCVCGPPAAPTTPLFGSIHIGGSTNSSNSGTLPLLAREWKRTHPGWQRTAFARFSYCVNFPTPLTTTVAPSAAPSVMVAMAVPSVAPSLTSPLTASSSSLSCWQLTSLAGLVGVFFTGIAFGIVGTVAVQYCLRLLRSQHRPQTLAEAATLASGEPIVPAFEGEELLDNKKLPSKKTLALSEEE